jgi:DNA-binding response OmpR family regulator
VEAQGGEVGVTSIVGKGSTFYAVLPRIDREAQREAPAPDAGAALVVEDDPRDQQVLSRALRAAGYRVEVAPTCAAARQALAAQRFDAVTLDLLLPDGSGADLIGEIRGSTLNRDARLIVVTVVAERALNLGLEPEDVLVKPVDAGGLSRALDGVAHVG